MESVTSIALVVNGEVHSLNRGTDVQDLKDAIVAAVRAGGDFVDVRGARDQLLSVFVSASSALLISKAVIYPDDELSGGALFDDFGSDRAGLDDFDAG